uniref:RNB domain-containing protein n=1 Tax=viral metagenome TaxID=1070528 RepID=A0A6C0DRU3_9ZZZZ
MDRIQPSYKILINDKTYTSWSFIEPGTNLPVTSDSEPRLDTIEPIRNKLFSRDVFVFNADNSITVIQNYLKSCISIAGVLMLENNKSFGRTKNKKRLLYKCIPDDRHYPPFLVPYDIKTNFSKVLKNKYILFRFDNWDEKHPQGIIVETIGDVDRLDCFYEFQLHCKSLHVSLTDFTNKTREQLNKKTSNEFVELIFKNPDYCIEDRRTESIITIDPLNSCDYDDGYGITEVNEDKWRLTIYIANVYFWLEALGLWNTFSKRVATIYLPDRRRPMLPTILSDTLCSLQEGQQRFALALDIFIDSDGNIYEDESVFKNVLINVKKNYVYEDPKLLKNDPIYIQLLAVSKLLDKTIENSHDIVAHWMVYMNTFTGKKMLDNKFGIFRSLKYIQPSKDEIPASVDMDTLRVIKLWNNTIGQYLCYEDGLNIDHELLKTKSYTHITSPIRRLVDLLNQILLFKNLKMINNVSQNAMEFLDYWINQLDYVNTSMRSIRKIQTDCALLDRCFNNPNIMEETYVGTIFDKICRQDGTTNYMVYLHELKLLSRISHSYIQLENYRQYNFKIYLFEDEEKIRKKIKVTPII